MDRNIPSDVPGKLGCWPWQNAFHSLAMRGMSVPKVRKTSANSRFASLSVCTARKKAGTICPPCIRSRASVACKLWYSGRKHAPGWPASVKWCCGAWALWRLSKTLPWPGGMRRARAGRLRHGRLCSLARAPSRSPCQTPPPSCSQHQLFNRTSHGRARSTPAVLL